MRSSAKGWGRRVVLLGCPVLLAASVAACASGSGSGSVSCAIPDGTYTYVTTGSGGADCLSGTYTATYPPTVPVGDSGVVAGETCTRTKSNGKCQETCVPQASSDAPTTTTTYNLTSSSGGYSGTTTSPVSGPDGGVDYTCSYSFTATMN